jgi:hypothetical protein
MNVIKQKSDDKIKTNFGSTGDIKNSTLSIATLSKTIKMRHSAKQLSA